MIPDPADAWWGEPHWERYAVSDVFFGEVCVLSLICRNAEQLFSVERGDRFVCDFNEAGFGELANALLNRGA
eukprot:7256242-Prymnesium_polylepis.1